MTRSPVWRSPVEAVEKDGPSTLSEANLQFIALAAGGLPGMDHALVQVVFVMHFVEGMSQCHERLR